MKLLPLPLALGPGISGTEKAIKNYPQNFGKAKVMEFNKYKNFAARNFCP